MNFILDFLRQKAPNSGKEMPVYYRKALRVTAVLLTVFFLASFTWFGLAGGWWEWVPLAAAAVMVATLFNVTRMGPRLAGLIVSFVVEAWCAWCVHSFGWSSSSQQLLIAPLMLSFFNVSEKPPLKILFWSGLVLLRLALYAYASVHVEVHVLSEQIRAIFLIFNTVSLYTVLACLCILFSSNVQAAERQLRLDNQELHKEAGTDPLTQLPNRRALMNDIRRFLEHSSQEPFSVAIADIDFFKRVNDTYGHNCGDYTLRTLADKFRAVLGDQFGICRWGGEEFCIFMPGLNLDEAGVVMHDLCIAVRKMPLSFEGVDFSITITIGVSENDFHSPLDAILEEADRKLYIGKNSGRDQVVL